MVTFGAGPRIRRRRQGQLLGLEDTLSDTLPAPAIYDASSVREVGP